MENKWMERGRTGGTGGTKQNKENRWNGESEQGEKRGGMRQNIGKGGNMD